MADPVTVRVTALYVAADPNSLVSSPQQRLEFTLEGILGEGRHPPAFVRSSDSRDKGIPRGTPVRNWRQWSAVSLEELQSIAEELGIPELDGALLGANIVFTGMPSFTQVPRGSTIWFPSGAVLSVECENGPCTQPGDVISQSYPHVKPSQFPAAAMHRRGLVGVVYVAGTIELGNKAEIRPPRVVG